MRATLLWTAGILAACSLLVAALLQNVYRGDWVSLLFLLLLAPGLTLLWTLLMRALRWRPVVQATPMVLQLDHDSVEVRWTVGRADWVTVLVITVLGLGMHLVLVRSLAWGLAISVVGWAGGLLAVATLLLWMLSGAETVRTLYAASRPARQVALDADLDGLAIRIDEEVHRFPLEGLQMLCDRTHLSFEHDEQALDLPILRDETTDDLLDLLRAMLARKDQRIELQIPEALTALR